MHELHIIKLTKLTKKLKKSHIFSRLCIKFQFKIRYTLVYLSDKFKLQNWLKCSIFLLQVEYNEFEF